jgi:enoyl-CoA hydratase
MSQPVLLVERGDGFATVTLDRPDAMNALSAELRAALVRAFEELQRDPEIRVVILTGSGRAFCAGLDLKELGDPARGGIAGAGQDVVRAVAAFDGPVIGAVNGFAITGGFELALACDLLVASSEARFADTHARVGILPGWGLSQKLPRLIGISRTKELAFTGNYVDAQQALAWGLVNRVVEPAALLPTCHALARDMLSCVPEALRGYKQLIDAGYATSFGEGLDLERRSSREHARSVTPELVAERRVGVQERGRGQSRAARPRS